MASSQDGGGAKGSCRVWVWVSQTSYRIQKHGMIPLFPQCSNGLILGDSIFWILEGVGAGLGLKDLGFEVWVFSAHGLGLRVCDVD